MQEVTLLIAIFLAVLVIAVEPIWGLIIYIAALGWYPSYLSVQLGTLDFTVTRIVIIALLAAAVFKSTQTFKLIWLDKFVVLFFICQLIAGAVTTELEQLFENRAGAAFDFVLPYFATRLIINSYEKYITLLKAIVVIAMPLMVVGFYQCWTGHNPVGFLKEHYAWREFEGQGPIMRHGFYRADVTFPMSIMFGLFFSMLGPLVVGLYGSVEKLKKIAVIGTIVFGIGVFSSMSSGPMLGMIVAGIFGLLFRYRHYWKTIIIVMVIGCAAVEILSNRHFYDVMGRFTLSPGTAWYRSKLIDVALFQGGMDEHWATGHGFTDPGWSLQIDSRDHTDIVNHYLLILSVFGLVGLVPFIAMLAIAVKCLVKGFKRAISIDEKWLIWCLGASIVGTLAAMNTVSLFGQPVTVLFITIALCGCIGDDEFRNYVSDEKFEIQITKTWRTFESWCRCN